MFEQLAHLQSTAEFQMSLILFVALAGYILASRINQSAVVGEILVGLLIGPSFLGLITYTEFVRNFAQLGAIVLLFVIGLEFKLRELVEPKYLGIALLGVIVPWVSGYYLGSLFGFPPGESLFLGTALSATSIAITANVLRELGKLHTKSARAILGAAVIDDVLGLFLLSISRNLVSGSISALQLGLTVAKGFAFLAGGVVLGYVVVSKLLVSVDKSLLVRKYPELTFIFAMMVAFLYATVAEFVGLSAIIGSFIAGVVLQGIGIKHGKHFREGAEYFHIIFASVFFVSLGILTNMRELTKSVLFFAVVLSVVAIVSKLIGCGIPAKIMGFSWKGALAVGVGMAPRGEVAMIVALIGLNQGLISQHIYVALVFMSLATTILPAIVLRRWVYGGSAPWGG